MEKQDIEKVAHLETNVKHLHDGLTGLEKEVKETNKVLSDGFKEINNTLISHISTDKEYKKGLDKLLNGIVEESQKKAADDKAHKDYVNLELAKNKTRIATRDKIYGGGGLVGIIIWCINKFVY